MKCDVNSGIRVSKCWRNFAAFPFYVMSLLYWDYIHNVPSFSKKAFEDSLRNLMTLLSPASV